MNSKIAAGIVVAISLVLVAVLLFSGYFEKPSEFDLSIVDINVKNPQPSLLNNRAVTIDPGEAVILSVTVQNKGEEIIYQNAYCVGMEVVYPDEGAKYWKLTPEQPIMIDLGPGGKLSYTFKAVNRKDLPFSGNFKIQAYITALHNAEKLVQSDNVIIKLRPPTSPQTSLPAETSSPGFEAVFVIIGVMTVLYLTKRRK